MTTQLNLETERQEIAIVDEAVRSGEYVVPPGVAIGINTSLGDFRARTRRERQALENGWEPWERSRHMHFGFIDKVPKSRWLGYWPAIALLCSAAAGYVSYALSLGTIESLWFVAFAVIGATLTSAGGAVGIIAWIATWWDFFANGGMREYKDIDKSVGAYTVVRGGNNIETRTTLYFCGLLPKAIWQKYQQDCHLFDRVYVASTDRSLFEKRTRQIRLGDPFLIGVIGDQFYLGGQWDLAKELKPVLEEDSTETHEVPW